MNIKELLQNIIAFLGVLSAFIIGSLTLFQSKSKAKAEIDKMNADTIRIHNLIPHEIAKLKAETELLKEQTRKLKLENGILEKTNSL